MPSVLLQGLRMGRESRMRNTINFAGFSDLSVIGQGTWYMGENPAQRADEVAALQVGLECGLKLIDTAEMYADGGAEEVVGQALLGRRDRALLVSKVYPWNAGEVDAIAACEHSLRRLQTDYLDLYQVHWPQRPTNCFGKLGYSWNESAPAVTLLETLEALAECQRAGKIRYIGVSNETAFGVMRYLHLADKHDLPRIVTIQNPYSLLNRSYEVGLAEVTQYEEVELLAYSCLGFGTLTGKYLKGAKPAGARNTLFSRFTRYSGEQTQKAVAAYVDIAKRHGLDPAQMALAFVRRQPFVASTLLGATTMEQLKTNIESFHLNLSEEVLAEIEAVHQVYTYPAP